jgi:hypothetical protein
MEINAEAAVAIVVAVGSAGWALWERWRKSRAEAKLEAIETRGRAPFLEPYTDFFTYFFIAGGESGDPLTIAPDMPSVLSWRFTEVPRDLQPGTPIVLVLRNTGEPARHIKLTLDDKPIELKHELAIENASGIEYIVYNYDPALHGRDQVLQLSFETASGYKGTHKYLTKHGMRSLVRTDPD